MQSQLQNVSFQNTVYCLLIQLAIEKLVYKKDHFKGQVVVVLVGASSVLRRSYQSACSVH